MVERTRPTNNENCCVSCNLPWLNYLFHVNCGNYLVRGQHRKHKNVHSSSLSLASGLSFSRQVYHKWTILNLMFVLFSSSSTFTSLCFFFTKNIYLNKIENLIYFTCKISNREKMQSFWSGENSVILPSPETLPSGILADVIQESVDVLAIVPFVSPLYAIDQLPLPAL